MIKNIKNFIRKVGEKLGLMNKLKYLEDHNEIAIPKEFYSRIDLWRTLYRGKHSEWHKFTSNGINGACERTIDSLNLPKIISNKMATLIFNERCSISISDENFNLYIDEVFKDNKFITNFQNSLESMFAMGGHYIKPFIEKGKVRLSYISADCFVPLSWDSTEVKDGVFISEFVNEKGNYTLLEFHLWENENYVVRNELYKSNDSVTIGKRVPLGDLFENLVEETVFRDVKHNLYAHFKPNIANNFDQTIPLGISLYANSLDVIRNADIKYDSLNQEFVLGRKRLFISEHMINVSENAVTGKLDRYFDTTTNLYESLRADDTSQQWIHEFNPELRVQEHVDGINTDLELLSAQIGWSPGTLSFNTKTGLKTATEVISENSETFRTKQSHENLIEQSLTDLIYAIGYMANTFGLFTTPKEYDVTVSFDDSIIQDEDAKINKQILLISQQLQSKIGAMMDIYGITKEEAELKLKEIKEEMLLNEPSYEEMMNASNFGGRE